MKKLILLLFLSLFIFPIGLKANTDLSEKLTSLTKVTCDYYVTVLKIVDGDTFIGLTIDSRKVLFRLQGIDSPEQGQPYSDNSKDKLAELITGKLVGIKIQEKPESYGRLKVWAYTPNGNDVSAEMLRAGLSWHFRKYDNSSLYSQLENEARKNHTGIWTEANPISPWDFRKNSNKRFLKILRRSKD